MANSGTEQKSEKKFIVTLLLCLFLGGIGVHRFYVGRTVSGIFMILTVGGLGFWTLVDLFVIATKNFKDKNGVKITE